jgi:3-phenylpropionate/cinnamic acid dioxygenase small subunit
LSAARDRAWAEANRFLADEAHLLDDRRYEDWLKLVDDDCLYWMPVDPLSADGSLRLNVFYDDRTRLEDRIARLTSGSAFSEEPPSLTSRIVAAVQVADADEEEGLTVRSNFSIVVYRGGEQRQFGGRLRHRLVRRDGRLCIAEKQVVLLGSDAPQRPLTFLF